MSYFFSFASPENSSSDVPQVSMETGSPTCDSVAAHVMTDPLEGEPGAEDDVVEKVFNQKSTGIVLFMCFT